MIELELPEPPSVNAMWRRVGNRTLLSKAGRLYRERVALIAARAKVRKIQGPVVIDITWRRARRSGDLDNRAKAVIDSLSGFAYEDDRQVIELHMYRQDDRGNPGATVTVRAA